MIPAVLACFGCTRPQSAPSSPAEPAVDARKPTRHVIASSLKLREEPSAKARVRGRLSINTPLELVGTSGDFAEVLTRNGKRGFVAKAYLDTHPVTKAAALERAKGDETLSWLQRAAAVAPYDAEVLRKLADAYLEAGRGKSAAMVGRILERLQTRFWAIPEGDSITVQWRIQYPEGDFRSREVPKSLWPREGLDPKTPFWVLPSHGPAVAARATRAEWSVVNECGASAGFVVTLELESALAKGARPFLAAVGARPEGWGDAGPPTGEPEMASKAKKAALELAKSHSDYAPIEDPSFPQVSALSIGEHRYWTRVVIPTQEGPDAIFQPYLAFDIEVADGKASFMAPPEAYDGPYPTPVALRDVDGDGRPDRALRDGCWARVLDERGEQIAASEYACCGC